jgi:hypothetical protein
MRRATCLLSVVVAACGLAALSPTVHAQRIPFFDAAGTGFDPEIDVVESGALLDAQATVSHDLKYVTINARPSQSTLLALRPFSFATSSNRGPALGFVGGAGGQPGANGVNAAANAPPRRRLPARPGRDGDSRRRASSLDRPGMALVARLQD